MNVEALYSLFCKHPNVCTDSRRLRDADLFFALRGDRFDGNSFAATALQQGAAAVVVDKPDVVRDERYILVDDTLKALQQLAAYHRRRLDIPFVALTGTNGKTTTKELIHSVLSMRYRTLATEGNLNNHIGVPLTLLRADSQTEIAIIEMGANHPGEIRELCAIAQPSHGLITNIGKAHLEGFGGAEGVRQTKKELYDSVAERGGVIFYNDLNPVLTGILPPSGARLTAYSSQCGGEIIAANPCLKMRLTAAGRECEVQTALAGAYNLENALAAVCVGRYFDVPLDDIAQALSNYRPQNNRSQIVQTERNTLLLDCYNANPTSMEAALTGFLAQAAPDSMVILGDMFELGETSDAEHRRIVDILASASVESIVVGEHFARASAGTTSIRSFADMASLSSWLEQHQPRAKFILVKGSHGMHLEEIRQWL